jgi:uncharacterized protein YbjT (DUF2867 family)
MTNGSGTVLVLGGTGKTGRRVVERLQARGVAVRVGSRSASPPFEWKDPASWGPALAGASAVYVSYYPDLAVPGAPEAVGALADEARRQGVQRLVLLSGRGEEEAQRAEQVVQGAGLEWTVVRCSWFNQNFSEDYLLEPILEGEVALPAGDTPEPFVDTEDIADVAVVALTEPGHSGRVYELTGPRLLTFAEAIAEIGRGTGRELRSIPISVEEYAAGAADQGLPEDVIGLVQYLFSEVLDGRNAQLADGVQQALGREPRDFADYVRETAATGVWNP